MLAVDLPRGKKEEAMARGALRGKKTKEEKIVNRRSKPTWDGQLPELE